MTFCANMKGKSVKEGAKAVLYVLLSPETEEETGQYYSGCTKTRPSSLAENEEDQKRLWDISVQLTQLNENK